ncbi:hypothetical protein [Streptomyces sp. NRRL S-350]|uniref:hypothetical protein n=1 Tax=Streptomyces sp. NRRL S-350 TaxID=1463902 RepID=UPI0004C282D0|nr:hypothetical protein [Streptomyces sp. NRRL S-350]
MTEHNYPGKQEIRARQRLTGETFMQARRRLAEGRDLKVSTIGYLLSTSLPVGPRPDFTAPAEEVLAALVANSAQALTRQETNETYPAWADVVVLRPRRPARPDEAPPGWYPVEAMVAVRARRVWCADEDERVRTDAYRAAKAFLLRMWPDLPEDWQTACMALDVVAMMRGWDDQALRQVIADPLARATTIAPDPTLIPDH